MTKLKLEESRAFAVNHTWVYIYGIGDSAQLPAGLKIGQQYVTGMALDMQGSCLESWGT